MKNNKTLKICQYFPENKQTWKAYLKTSVPVILAAIIFALNSFVDNFMSTNISGGNQALAYANTYTELVIGIISLTTIIGTTIFAQYLGKKDYDKLKQTINLRILFAFFIAFIFSLVVWIIPTEMIKLVSGFDDNLISLVLDKSTIYLRIITASWLINAIWFTYTMILREKNHSLVSFFSSLISLIVNIVLNSIFIFGLKYGIEFLAISTIISNIISFMFVLIFIYLKDKQIAINWFKIFKINPDVLKYFFQRITSFLLLAVGSVAITIRFIFWNIGYPTNSIGDYNYYLSAANILGVSGMFFNIFWTALEAVHANVAVYVGQHLGNDAFELAEKNAKQLSGFHLILAIFMGMLLFAFSFGIEKMTFLANGYKQGLIETLSKFNFSTAQIDLITHNAVSLFMSQIKYTLWPLAFFMPIFIWFITRSRIISAGGYTNLIGLIEAIFGLVQLAWLNMICLWFNQNNTLSFPISYFLFYLLDLIKFIVYEVLYYKIDWKKNIINHSLINKSLHINKSIAKFK